jgi:hypothetical protein
MSLHAVARAVCSGRVSGGWRKYLAVRAVILNFVRQAHAMRVAVHLFVCLSEWRETLVLVSSGQSILLTAKARSMRSVKICML